MSEKFKVGRRGFLTIVGATSGAVACSPRHGSDKLMPYLVPPDEIIPGTPVFYRGVCRGCSAGCGVTARTREGRVVKLEGNPDDPISGGALCARGQAELQQLYAPDRFRGPMKRDAGGNLAPIAWDAVLGELSDALTAAVKKNPKRIRLVTRPEPGSAGAVQRAFFRSLGSDPEQRLVLDPLDIPALREAGRRLFGREERPGLDLAQAKSVVAFGADFLETWGSPVEQARGFAAGRGKVGSERTRLTWVGPRLSMTGASADLWIAARPGTERDVALGLLRWLVLPANAVRGLAPGAADLLPLVERFTPQAVEASTSVPAAQLEALARELVERRPSALLGPGISSAGPDATELAEAVLLVNYVLGNLGKTVLYGQDPAVDPASSFDDFKELAGDMSAGRVDVLVLAHADLAADLPASLGIEKALANVPLVVSFASRPDGSTAAARYVLPDHHQLESFGDVTTKKGVVALSQPAMQPLFDTRAAAQTLLDLSARIGLPAGHFPYEDYYEYCQTHTETYAMLELGKAPDLVAIQRAALERGGYFEPAPPAEVTLSREELKPFALRAARPAGLALLPFPTPLRASGRVAAPWLQETGDPTSTVTWMAWVEVSPVTAARLGVRSEDKLKLTTAAGAVELPVYVYPRLADGVVGVPLGVEVLALLPAERDEGSGGLAWVGAAVTAAAAGRAASLPLLSVVSAPTTGDIVFDVTPAHPELPQKPEPEQMYAAPGVGPRRWAMSIDLDKCTGCSACTVACYAENNIPVLGPDFVSRGRNMAWLNIERYFTEGGIRFLPMLCQQCGDAPCETVCPVYATYHTKEGLNAQVYNRCVGTRYCSNNCPYKARVFNYVDPVFAAPLNMQLNPDVTVREKGVMEKCTFCVQRIRYAENQARDEKRGIADGEIVPACEQTCPSQAIVFGDANDPSSRVAKLRREPRGFRALEELDTRPGVTYLARVREDA